MSDKKRSKVKKVTGSGTWENANGVDLGNGKKGFFSFEYEMEDGEIFKANHKSDTGYAVGSDVEYVITGSNEYGKRGKVQKPQDGNRNQYQQRGGRQSQAAFALSYAKDIYMTTTDNPKPPNEVVDDVTAMADGFLKWLNANN